MPYSQSEAFLNARKQTKQTRLKIVQDRMLQTMPRNGESADLMDS